MVRFIYIVIGSAWLLSMTLVYAQTTPARVWVALAEGGGAYAETAEVLLGELSGKVTLTSGKWQTVLEGGESPPDLIVTVGVDAFDGALAALAKRDKAWSNIPVLATLLPRAAYDEPLEHGLAAGRMVSAALLDQPLDRQLALIRRALPDRRRIGVLTGPRSRSLLAELHKESAKYGFKLVSSPVESGAESIYAALKTVLEQSDVILALPDPSVYSSATLQNILMTTYRARTPLVAFSPAYVKAGAVLAVYSTPAQVARQAAGMVRSWQASHILPPPQMPGEFTVTENAKVVASFGLALDNMSEITEDLRRQQEAR